jgi:hypothetical protein
MCRKLDIYSDNYSIWKSVNCINFSSSIGNSVLIKKSSWKFKIPTVENNSKAIFIFNIFKGLWSILYHNSTGWCGSAWWKESVSNGNPKGFLYFLVSAVFDQTILVELRKIKRTKQFPEITMTLQQLYLAEFHFSLCYLFLAYLFQVYSGKVEMLLSL